MLAGALTLAAAGLMYIGIPFGLGLVVWFFLALAMGLAVGRWWALVLAAIPWPLGAGGGLLTGRYAYLGDGWEAIVALIIGIGLMGITTGVLLAPHAGTLRWYDQ
jgi:hypothetical protein